MTFKAAASHLRSGGSHKANDDAVIQANVMLTRVEPWTIMKFSLIVSVAAWITLVVAVSVLYLVLSWLGVFHSIDQSLGLLTYAKDAAPSSAASWLSAGTIISFTAIAGAIDAIAATALCTLGAVTANMIMSLSGGIEVTLQESSRD